MPAELEERKGSETETHAPMPPGGRLNGKTWIVIAVAIVSSVVLVLGLTGMYFGFALGGMPLSQTTLVLSGSLAFATISAILGLCGLLVTGKLRLPKIKV